MITSGTGAAGTEEQENDAPGWADELSGKPAELLVRAVMEESGPGSGAGKRSSGRPGAAWRSSGMPMPPGASGG